MRHRLPAPDAYSARLRASAPGPAATPQEPIRLPKAERKPASSHRTFSAARESLPPPSSSPHSAPDVRPRSTSSRPMAFPPPSARTPRLQASQKEPATASAPPPWHAPLFRLPPRAVFRTSADRFSYHRTPAVFP